MAGTKEENKDLDIDKVIVIKEPGEDEYSVSDSALTFNLKILDDGSLAVTDGKIVTPYFIQNSALEMVKTWRYELHNVVLDGIAVDAVKNTLTYSFTLEDPGDFLEYTTLAESEDKPEAEI